MTPTKKGEATHIKIERRRRLAFDDSDVAHVAGGQHKGLVINKQTAGLFCLYFWFDSIFKINLKDFLDYDLEMF